MLENTSIYNLNRIYFHKLTVGNMICRREGWKVSVNILFSLKSFLFNIMIGTQKVLMCGSECVFSSCVYVWASENVWAHFWGKPTLCEFVCSGSQTYLRRKIKFQHSSIFFLSPCIVNFCLFLHSLSISILISILLWKLPFHHPFCSPRLCVGGFLSCALSFTLIMPPLL